MKLTDLIVPTTTDNLNNVQDLIYLPNFTELRRKYNFQASDLLFGRANDFCQDYWFRKHNLHDNSDIKSVRMAKSAVMLLGDFPKNYQADCGVRPCMRLSVENYLHLVGNLDGYQRKSYTPYSVMESGKNYMMLNFGEYPRRDHVLKKNSFDSMTLEKEFLKKFYRDEDVFANVSKADKLFSFMQGSFIKGFSRNADDKDFRESNKYYFHKSHAFKKGKFKRHEQHLMYDQEYTLNNKKFVRVGHRTWAPVESLQWVILNWDNLPITINPQGKGTDDTIDLICYNTIAQLPYYLDRTEDLTEKLDLWKDSTIRAFLNGYRKDFTKKHMESYIEEPFYDFYSEDFTFINFLNQAFQKEAQILKTIDASRNVQVSKKNDDIVK